MLIRLPGVYPPQEDTWLLADIVAQQDLRAHSRVLDICTGTGALAVRAAQTGAGHVTALDISRRAFTTAWLNSRIRGHRIRVLRGDLVNPVRDERFDLVISNPPYVPAHNDALPATGIARAWDAGKDGRALLDRICRQAPEVLDQGGTLLLAQSALSGVEKTQTMLEEQGLEVDVMCRQEIPFGPVMTARRAMLENRGLIDAGQRSEELVVIRAVNHSFG
ncbi:MAG: HemK2/MTQ2 family protein methyltransferase [Rhodococcus sp. (in: high G+C Gram-positive bacteria)]|uniref:HemK2/MTQ2 family protein methyltransferase n=1 Tax=Rhodococcus sp. TaxID=1831 RepID=UPI003BB15CBE